LGGNLLTGNIPQTLGDLANLQSLNLNENQLTGSIPSSIGALANLQYLYLWTNHLTGSIPQAIGNLANLQNLQLGRNQLTGNIPPEIVNLTNLQYLSLDGNQFTGSIPSEIANLSNLKHLYLSGNQLIGSIPPEIAGLTNLEQLWLSENQLTGNIPPNLSNLANLISLALHGNQLTGSIPPCLGDLVNLQFLYLYDNQFTGNIPTELGNLANLIWLFLQNNQLTGSIPYSLCNLSNLNSYYFYNNYLDLGSCPAILCLIDKGVNMGNNGQQLNGLDLLSDCFQNPTVEIGVQADTLCATGAGYHFADVTASAYYTVNWSTSNGQGYFDTATILHPTYFPDSLDYVQGYVNISVEVTLNNLTASDNMVLHFVNEPQAFAGNDATIVAGNTYMLTEAWAHSFSAIEWQTAGDGVFDDIGMVNATYNPGAGDILAGCVTLTMIAQPLHSCTEPAQGVMQLCFVQATEITNVTAAQRTDGSKLVDIWYDLSAQEQQYIAVEVSFDNGLTFQPILTFSGDAGPDILPGNGKHIVWNVGNDAPNVTSSQTIFKVTASDFQWQCGMPLIDSRDGNGYSTISIGNQCWMGQNLAYLPQVSPPEEGSEVNPYYYVTGYFGTNATEAKATDHYQTYGVLYNWPAALVACPSGWHLPSDDEWKILEGNADSEYGVGDPIWNEPGDRGYDAGKNLKTEYGWDIMGFIGTDLFGFSGLPGGIRHNLMYFSARDFWGAWHSSDEANATITWFRLFSALDDASSRYHEEKDFGLSIRCLWNETVPVPAVITEPVIDITAHHAKSGGVVNSEGGAEVTARGVCWSATQTPDIDNNDGMTSDGSGLGFFTSNITGLAPNTTYYVRAYATNSAGTGYGNQIQFTTTAGNGIPCPGMPTITDIDGNVYNTVLIGNQCWMAENLKTTKYRNGTNITYPGSNNTAWQNNTTGAYAWYNNDISWKDLYGALYNWHAVNNTNGLCPTGWHVPTDAEWTQLVDYVVAQGFPNQWDNPNGAGNALKSCRQVNSPLGGNCNTAVHPRWNSHGTHHGFDEFGFSAFPGGYRPTDGSFYRLGNYGYWWSSTEHSSTSAWYRGMRYNHGNVNRYDLNKPYGFSVGCLRD
jgi:uncharacterized protein (TIGR02145 family)